MAPPAHKSLLLAIPTLAAMPPCARLGSPKIAVERRGPLDTPLHSGYPKGRGPKQTQENLQWWLWWAMKRILESSVLSRAERELLENCRDVVREVAPGAELILYGSRARGDAALESDYDLLILIDGPVDWQLEDRIRQRIYSLELESGAALSVSAYNRSDWCSPLYRAMPFNQNIEKEGIIL